MESIKYFESGYSCSESIIKEAIDMGLCDESLLSIATPFSGGLSSGCLCGAISGAQLVIGLLFGKNNKFGNEEKARAIASEFITRFKEKYPATCCRVLSKGFEFNSAERRENCKNLVKFCSDILKDMAIYEKV